MRLGFFLILTCAISTVVTADDSASGYVSLSVKALNGTVNADTHFTPLPNEIELHEPLSLSPLSSLPGFHANEIIVRHGKNLSEAPLNPDGTRNWKDDSFPFADYLEIPAEFIDGDVEIYVLFEESEDSDWTKVWGDEFNDTELDMERWNYQPRRNSTWNRFIAEGDERERVNVVEDGVYKSYCIPTPKEDFPEENVDMISGAINSSARFSFTGGRIEARIRTTLHSGNFPAFWLMPQTQEKGWPKDGEIDIWETIDDRNQAFHTVHTAWTKKSYGAPSVSSPKSTSNEINDHDLWHVYALEWDKEYLKWSVDGRVVFTYENQHYSDAKYSEEDTWPFYKDFYIILNQSVGDGTWAAPYDTDFTYLTEFDWVRVYQKKDDIDHISKISHNGDDPDFYKPETAAGIKTMTTLNDADGRYDLQGRKMNDDRQKGVSVIVKDGKAEKRFVK